MEETESPGIIVENGLFSKNFQEIYEKFFIIFEQPINIIYIENFGVSQIILF